MSHVFISYVHEDNERVQHLADILRTYDVETWLDRDQLKPGNRWQAAIREAIGNGAFYIACFSTAYNERSKTYMNEELTIAIEEVRQRPANKAWFIPVLLDGIEVPDRPIGAGETLRSLQWVDLQADWHDGVRRILSVIQPNCAKVYELIQRLGDPSARARIKAADDLGTLGPLAKQAVLPLAYALLDENATVRAAISEALGRIGVASGEIVLQLLDVMRQGEVYSSRHAAQALAMLGAPAIPALLEATSFSGLGIGDGAAVALGSVSDPAAVPLLIEALSDNSSITRAHAAKALGMIGDSTSIPSLKKALLDADNYVRTRVAEALRQLSASDVQNNE